MPISACFARDKPPTANIAISSYKVDYHGSLSLFKILVVHCAPKNHNQSHQTYGTMDAEVEKAPTSSVSTDEVNKTIWTEDEYMLATLGYKQGNSLGFSLRHGDEY